MSEDIKSQLIWASFLAVLVICIAVVAGIAAYNGHMQNGRAKLACIEAGGIYSNTGVCTWSQPG